MKHIWILVGIIVGTIGCEPYDDAKEQIDEWRGKGEEIKDVLEGEATGNETAEATESNVDAIDVSGARWLGRNYSGYSLMPGALRSVSRRGNVITIDCDRSGWPKGGPGWAIAEGCGFYEKDGQIQGGKFENIRYPGQKAKTLDNLNKAHKYNHHDYDGKSALWYMEITFDGRRTHAVRVK